MIEFLSQPWPWWAVGIVINITMVLLLVVGKNFGVSSTFRTLCSVGGAGKGIPFFDFNWKSQIWNIVFVLGTMIGGFISATWLVNPEPMAINPDTIASIESHGLRTDMHNLLPADIFSWEGLGTLRGIIFIVIGGFLVGFGTRYAGGCTSGHAISGLSNLQLPSLIAVVGFFIGGLTMTWLILPWIMGI